METKDNQRLADFLRIAYITIPPIGVFEVSDPLPFGPFKTPEFCIFNHFKAWGSGGATLVNKDNMSSYGCMGAGYWLCGVQGMPRKDVAGYLAGQEGLKASVEIMEAWLASHPPRSTQDRSIVIKALDSQTLSDHYEALRTITFFVRPDQLSLLLTGAEYLNADSHHRPVEAVYGSGCGLMQCMFEDLDTPRAMIGATDIAMRKYLPRDILAFTVTRPMLEQLCSLDESSFLHKTFWKELTAVRKINLAG